MILKNLNQKGSNKFILCLIFIIGILLLHYEINLSKLLNYKNKEIDSLNTEVSSYKETILNQNYLYSQDLQFIVDEIYKQQTYLSYNITDTLTIGEKYSIELYKEIINQSIGNYERVSNYTRYFFTSLSELSTNVPSIMPLKPSPFLRITSAFGYRISPINYTISFHNGVDFASKPHSEIVATGDGEVVQVYKNHPVYGKTVIIKHSDNVLTLYGHLSSILVKLNKTILKGDIIGKTGNTGQSTGDHLHYTIIINGKEVDPMNFIVNVNAKDTEVTQDEFVLNPEKMSNLLAKK